MGVACGTYGGEERFIESFGRKHGRIWKDNIKMGLKEIK
jgi:hypothetical protein